MHYVSPVLWDDSDAISASAAPPTAEILDHGNRTKPSAHEIINGVTQA